MQHAVGNDQRAEWWRVAPRFHMMRIRVNEAVGMLVCVGAESRAGRPRPPRSSYGFWESALPASVFVVELLRPSWRAFDAFSATPADVCLPVPDWANTLPANDFCLALAELLVNVCDALVAMLREV